MSTGGNTRWGGQRTGSGGAWACGRRPGVPEKPFRAVVALLTLVDLPPGGARLDRLTLTRKQALPSLSHFPLRPKTALLATRHLSLTPRRFQQSPLPDPPRPASSASPEFSPASFSRRAKAERRLSQLQRDIALVLSRRLHLGGLRAFRSRFKRPTRRQRILLLLGLALAVFITAYNLSISFRHGVIAVERCATIAWAVVRAIIDYKLLFRKSWPETEEGLKQRHEDYENTHWTAAVRLREALKKLGGVYIKVRLRQTIPNVTR